MIRFQVWAAAWRRYVARSPRSSVGSRRAVRAICWRVSVRSWGEARPRHSWIPRTSSTRPRPRKPGSISAASCGFALVALDLGERVPRLPTTMAFRLKFAVRRTDIALLIVGRRRLTGSSAALAVETLREGIEWTGPGPAPTRLARVRTTTRVLRALRGAPGQEPSWWCA